MDLFIDGPEGSLEAVLWRTDGDAPPRAASIVCHPHPEHGGSLETAVVHRVAKGLQEAGVAALRFNFRGVGRSAGSFHGGFGPGGEEDDALAALDALAERFPGAELWAAGFSFGARTVAALAQREPRIRRVVLVALPLLTLDCSVVDTLETDGLAVQAGADEFGNLSDLQEHFPELHPGLRLAEVEGADHLFRGKTKDLQALVHENASRWLEEQR